jgi:hypothetical protein
MGHLHLVTAHQKLILAGLRPTAALRVMAQCVIDTLPKCVCPDHLPHKYLAMVTVIMVKAEEIRGAEVKAPPARAH